MTTTRKSASGARTRTGLVAGYARVSSADQHLDRQLDELTAAGCTRAWQETASGKRGANRPEWDNCLSHLRKGDTLVVTELSRLGRNTGDLARLLDDLNERGIALRILNLGVDTSTAAGRLIFTIIAAVAEMERLLLIERTRSGLDAARARGRTGGRTRTITDAQITKAKRLLDTGQLTGAEVAAAVGISRSRLYHYLRDDSATSD